jgi:anthranilate phosphoribosyltransferase
LYVAGIAASLAEGVEAAGRLLESGKPWAKIEALVDYTAGL